MRRRWILAAALAAANVGATAEAGILVPIPPVPGSSGTYIRDINNNNVVAGSYSSTTDGRLHGFVGGLDGNYTTFVDANGGAQVEALSDDGYIVGHSDEPSEDCTIYGCQFFRTPNGTIREITKDGTVIDGIPGQITTAHKYVGKYFLTQGQFYEGNYYGKNAKYVSELVLSGYPHGFSKGGVITGITSDGDDHDLGFVFQNGVQTTYKYPDANAVNTQFDKLNKHGVVAGGWYDENYTYSHAFLFDSRSALFEPIDTPTGTYAYALSINNAGIATVSVDTTSYIYCPHKKTCPISAGAIEVKDRWISVGPAAVARVCEHDCVDKAGRSKALSQAELAWMPRPQERERRLPFRP